MSVIAIIMSAISTKYVKITEQKQQQQQHENVWNDISIEVSIE